MSSYNASISAVKVVICKKRKNRQLAGDGNCKNRQRAGNSKNL